MEYISPISQQLQFQQEQPQPLNRNQRRLQLRHNLSNKIIPQIGSLDNEEEHIILQTRRRSSSTSSKGSHHSHYTSPFEEYEEFGIFSEYPEERSKPSTPVDDILPDASPLRLGGSAASTLRRNGHGKELRKASFYSEASTLVSDGFGDLMLLSSQSVVGPRFYESGSGSGSDHGGSKRERGSYSVMSSSKRRATTRGKINMGSHNIYTTPPRGGITRDTSDHHYLEMNSEDTTKYIEQLEQKTEELTAQINNLTSPTSSTSNVAKLKRLTAENRALKDEITEWKTLFDDKVKEECRSKIIANEMETRSRVRGMEQTLEETRETVKILHADIDRLNSIIEEVAHERDMAEKEKREVELKVEVLTDMLRAREGESRGSSRCSSRAGGRHDGAGRYSQGSYSGSVMAALRRTGPGRPLSISSSQFEESDGEEYPGSPTQEPGTLQSRKRLTRSFERGSLPQPLVLPTTMGISHPTSPIDSRPSSAHSNTHPYGAGMQENSSNISIDSGRTPSVRSGMSAIVTGGNSLFAELSMLDDGMSEVSHRDDVSEYSRLHSRVPSYTSFARHHHRGPSLITSPVAATPRIRSPTPLHSQLRSPIRSPILAATVEPIPVPTVQLPPPRSGLFSTLTRTSSGPLHLVADALTRYRLGKLLIALGHGLKSPRVTLHKVKNKACEVAVKALTGEMGVERVSKKRRKVWHQRGNAWNEDRNCSRCSTHDRGRKIGKSARRSVSAPISSRVSNVRLSPGTPIEGVSREHSLVRDQSPSRRPPQQNRKRRVSTTSKQQGSEPVRRVHAGDNVWLWIRVLMAIAVTLGVVGNNDKMDEKVRYKEDVAITDDEDNYSDYLGEVDEDEQDTPEIKVDKWRRNRVSDFNSC